MENVKSAKTGTGPTVKEEKMPIKYCPDGLTIRELKAFICNMPDQNGYEEDYEVWLQSGDGMSRICTSISSLNQGDILLEYEGGD